MFALKLLSRLPFAVLYVISDFLFFVSYRLVKYRRKLVWKNLKNSFPNKSDSELRKIEKIFYKNLCDYGVETIKLLTISKEELGRRVKFVNPELSIKYLSRGQSLLNLASHQFNWEWLLVAGSFVLPGQMDFVYQPVNNKFFDEFTRICRTRFGAHGIKRDSVAREIIRRKNIVRNIAIVGDQYPGWGHDKRYAATFLHQPTVFFSGPNQLAQLTQYPVLYYAMRKVKRGYYETKIVELSLPPYEKENADVLKNYIREVERVIHNDPAGWLWSHNRWKTRHLKENQLAAQP
ncbi:lysophospholipid acyltransferase family protein [Chryseolinea sp. H1M3-3]|uniref:lysophospholipid acyltransferase family protein n=1 Tax=Chryseolinea sp. H1M3-3 TaxID=3034144 RepID=UPI0023EC144A|nr:lysophospholipid acyltransferase family protein [Chryseolinea sp. H1M3-3]